MKLAIPQSWPRWDLVVDEINKSITLKDVKCLCMSCPIITITHIDSDTTQTVKEYFSEDDKLLIALDNVLAALYNSDKGET
jgi:hypothetical protein